MLTQTRLKELLSYCPNTGVFTWLDRRYSNVQIGDRAVGTKKNGYSHISIDRKRYATHRLAWLYVHGELPEFIDHVNGIRDDNRIANLRPATKCQNGMNRKRGANNTSGYKGVTWHKSTGMWVARITHNCKRKSLGYFNNPEDAHKAYCLAADELFGEFARHG